MPILQDSFFGAYQSHFHRCWGHLSDPHVRALAWLLDSPDLLDSSAAQWGGKIASLGADAAEEAESWLAMLDADPAALHAYLSVQPFTRLGHYAEKLMAFYFRHRNILVANGVQVRTDKKDKNGTIGEFDFLLRRGEDLLHWEFATKFYLFDSSLSCFIGPNLTDSLHAKMRKILERQLSLAGHPAAQKHLPQPVAAAQALVKGWLFYHSDFVQVEEMGAMGISAEHCCGFWCELPELSGVTAERYLIMPRLSWLAPVRIGPDHTLDWQALQKRLTEYFKYDSMPVLVALLAMQGKEMVEIARGFVVPNDWRSRAAKQIGH